MVIDPMDVALIVVILLAILLAGILGRLLGYNSARKQTPKETDNEQSQKLLSDISNNVNDAMIKAVNHLQEQSNADLKRRQDSIETLIKPLKETLNKSSEQILKIEKERQHDQGALKTQLTTVAEGQRDLQQETTRLVNALRKPQVRGRWGELTLRRTVELAGMEKYCDFEEQVQTSDEEGYKLRPDLTVHLPNKRHVIIDAKTPLDAYLDSINTEDDEKRSEYLERHAKQLQTHVKSLASKAYWQHFENTLDFVVMFIPGEQFLAAALEHAPKIQESALDKRVILATPGTLVALLRVIAYGWRQKLLEENAQEIRQLGEDLYSRTATFIDHLEKAGKQLSGSVNAYNSAIGSLERGLLPGARKLKELGITAKKEMADIKPIEASIRQISQRPDTKQSAPE